MEMCACFSTSSNALTTSEDLTRLGGVSSKGPCTRGLVSEHVSLQVSQQVPTGVWHQAHCSSLSSRATDGSANA
jgi:hypothetical protein